MRDRWLGPLAVGLCLVVVLAPAVVGIQGADVYVEEARFRGNQTDGGDQFGRSVDIDGDTALVGAWKADSAYIFTRQGPGQWEQQARLTPGDGTWVGAFGGSVALDGDTALVGDFHNDNENGDDAGAVYVFTRDPDGEWSQQAKILADDGDLGDIFGTVDLDGNVAAIGASFDDANGQASGSAYIFVREGTNWTQQAKITPDDGQAGDTFGTRVDVEGDRVLISSPFRNAGGASGVGAAYVFENDGSNWSQETKFTPSNDHLSPLGHNADVVFGFDVALEGGLALVGAPDENTVNGRWAGAVYVFERSDDGDWRHTHRLTAANGEIDGGLGWSVDLDGSTAVVAEENDDIMNGGAYVFTRQAEGVWTQQQLAASAAFAEEWRVAIDEGTVLVGAPSEPKGLGDEAGSAHVFRGVGSQTPQSLE